MSILAVYVETLIFKGLTVIWILMALTSNTHNLFHMRDIYQRLFVLYTHKSGYHFWLELSTQKQGKVKVHFFLSWELKIMQIWAPKKYSLTFDELKAKNGL